MSASYDPFKDPLLLDHEVDGIRELNNNLPRWWVWLFNLSIAFAVCYMAYYHVFRLGPLQEKQYEKENAIGMAIKAKKMAEFTNQLATLKPLTDPVVLAQGKAIFLNKCSPCHREDGGGKVGPNLCKNDHWLHGSNFVDNLQTIANGVPVKGMPTWLGMLKPNEIHIVGSYIYTLRNTHPVNPKPFTDSSQPAAPNPYE